MTPTLTQKVEAGGKSELFFSVSYHLSTHLLALNATDKDIIANLV